VGLGSKVSTISVFSGLHAHRHKPPQAGKNLRSLPATTISHVAKPREVGVNLSFRVKVKEKRERKKKEGRKEERKVEEFRRL
jgi:hypothetical protein